MLVVKITSGLGNQMFQYAYAKSLQNRGYQVKIDISDFKKYKLHGGYQLGKYKIDLEVATRAETRRFYKKDIFVKILRKFYTINNYLIREKTLAFDKNLLTPQDNNLIIGFFQCDKYFSDVQKLILEQFVINVEKSFFAKKIEDMILKSNNSCSVHVRRGDYILSRYANTFGFCGLRYYERSLQLLDNKFDNIKYFVFSDDIVWARKNIMIPNAIYVDSKEKREPHEDIYLMSLCNHNIIANSTFSWWGAWLNQNDNKVITAPKRWFADDELNKQSKNIVSDSWIKL